MTIKVLLNAHRQDSKTPFVNMWQRSSWFHVLLTKQLKRDKVGLGNVTINNAASARLPNVPVLNRWLRQKIDRSSFRLSIEVARKVNNCCMLFVV